MIGICQAEIAVVIWVSWASLPLSRRFLLFPQVRFAATGEVDCFAIHRHQYLPLFLAPHTTSDLVTVIQVNVIVAVKTAIQDLVPILL